MSQEHELRWALPDSWVWTNLWELGDIVAGGTPSTKEPSYWADEIHWISPADLTGYSAKTIKRGARSISRIGLANSSARVMPAGSVHFSSRAPIGYVVISAESLATNQGFKSLIPAPGIFNEYVYYYLLASREYARERASGTTFSELSGKAFGRLPIPLAPTATQRGIVAKIEELFSELDKGIESLKTARAQLKVYRQAVLKDAFEGKLTAKWRDENKDKLEKPEQLLARIKQEREGSYERQLQEWKAAVTEWEATGKSGKRPLKPKKLAEIAEAPDDVIAKLPKLPEGWLWVRLGDLSDISGGLTKNQKRNSLPRMMKYLRVANVYADKILTDDVYTIGVTEGEARKVALEVGDLLIVEGNGSIEQIGRVSVWEGELPVCGHQNHLIRARLATKFVPRFFLQFLLSPLGRELIVKEASSTSGLHTLSISKVSNLNVPVASSAEESVVVVQIEEKLERIDRALEDVDAQLAKSEALRQSILKKAFTGQLVPQDPNDEPASALLGRIKAERAVHSDKTITPGRRRRAKATA